MWKKNLIIISRRLISSLVSNEIFTNDLLRKRLLPYVNKTSYVDELLEIFPKFKQHQKASILLPIYCNERTNRVEILVLKRSEKVRFDTGMIAFPGGMTDLTDRDTIHTAEREAEEEIGLKPEYYSTLGCLPPVTDSRVIMITPIVALLNSPKFLDFRLLLDETTEAFYLDLKQFLYTKNNYKMFEIGDHFVTHHFDIDKYQIWGVTAFELILLATLVYQQTPEFPFFRHGQQLDLKLVTEQIKKHFHMCLIYLQEHKSQHEINRISRLK